MDEKKKLLLRSGMRCKGFAIDDKGKDTFTTNSGHAFNGNWIAGTLVCKKYRYGIRQDGEYGSHRVLFESLMQPVIAEDGTETFEQILTK